MIYIKDLQYFLDPQKCKWLPFFKEKKTKINLEVCILAWLLKKYHAPQILRTRSTFKLDLYDYIKVTYVLT